MSEADDILQQAMAAHAAGALEPAKALYARVLALRPEDPDALANFGGALLQQGRLAEGLVSIDASLSIRPHQADVLANKANALRLLGRLPEAEAAFVAAARLDPRQAAPLGDLLCGQGRLAEAAAAYDLALAAVPDLIMALGNRGWALRQLGRLQDALADFDAVLALTPDNFQGLCNRAVVLSELERFGEAAEAFHAALALQPNSAAVWNDLAPVELKRGQTLAALQAADRAIALRPDLASAHVTRAHALRELGRDDEALQAMRRGAALEPLATTWNNVGAMLQDQGLHEDALEAYHAATLAPPGEGQAEAHWNKAAVLLMLGRFEEGWPLMEWRRQRREIAGSFCDPGPPWLGETPLAGKTLLIRSEQGFGDSIQFCRYADLAADQGAKVIVAADGPLVELFRSLRGAHIVLPNGQPTPPFDRHCSMMSLPLAFGGVIPSEPYLHADPAKAEIWRRRLGERRRARVGLVWSGGARPEQLELAAVNARRNIALAKLAPLAAADVDFYSLQKGPPQLELAGLVAEGWDGPQITDLTAEIADFSDTAALVANLDLVIAVDTSTAHLAGAMGKPVWMLNRYDTCWRWMLERSDSPWYPSLRLFRQTRYNDWDPVIAAVVAALKTV